MWRILAATGDWQPVSGVIAGIAIGTACGRVAGSVLVFRTARVLNAVLLLGYFLICATLWPRVPSVVIMHFGAGNVAEPARRSLLSWFVLPVVAGMFWALMEGVSSYAARNPEVWHGIGPNDFGRIRAAIRTQIILLMRTAITWVAVIVTLLLMSQQAAILWVAVHHAHTLPSWANDAVLFGGCAIITILWTALRRATIIARAG